MKINWFKINDIDILFRRSTSCFININSKYKYLPKVEFSNILIYLTQGYICKDCNYIYYGCGCNYCESCDFRKCVCNFFNIENYLYKFIKLNFSNNLIFELINYIGNQTKYSSDCKINTIMSNLKNLVHEN